MNDQKKVNRIQLFDGLKGVAIITIIAYYLFQHLVPGGFLAVNLFLVIAGFFNFRHFTTLNLNQPVKVIKNYYASRFKRLFFPMLAMIMVTITYIMLFQRDFFYNIRNMSLSSLLFVNNYYQIFNEQSYFVQAANPSPFTHLWYVSLYAQLVLLTPLMVYLFYAWHRRPSISVNMLLIVSAISAILMAYLYDGGDPTRIYYDLLTRLSAYTFGGAIGYLYPIRLKPKPMKRNVKLTFNMIGTVAILLLFVMVRFMYGTQAFAYRFGLTLFSIVCGLFIISSIHPETLWSKIISFPVFTWLGKRSMSYYLWFYPVHLIIPSQITFINDNVWLHTLVQVVIIMVLAEITYQLFEKQAIVLPIGQDFNWKKMKYQVRYLIDHPQALINIKIITVIYLLFFVGGTVGLAITPETRDTDSEDLQTLIENNQQLAQDTIANNTQNNKVINNIEGLSQEELLYANGLDVTFIGDSVLLAAAEQINEVFPKAKLSGQEGRQLYNSVDVVKELESLDRLMPTVIVVLGSNGTFTEGQLNDFINAIGPDRSIYFLTSNADRSWVSDANSQLEASTRRFGNVNIIDWASYANDHPEWLRDYAHPTVEGSLEMAKLIAKDLYRTR
ncbi:acyltransferase family protein [Fundicoccus culcitae]|uniref:Acyltransferase n=1 Tax=Fundicoccus culcitae TaxID=2969821 RepID=A0ABY5P834_9LACT|nr:acyltransferase family protein [Fundicoccus culcitae]UUX34608.1 acyltransferase [Fundicoccus culcitae]